jgi:hypothetical protein
MRVKFICVRAEKTESWHRGCVVQKAQLVPVVDDSAEAHEYFAEAPAGGVELSGMAGERFKIGRTYSVYFEELQPEAR